MSAQVCEVRFDVGSGRYGLWFWKQVLNGGASWNDEHHYWTLEVDWEDVLRFPELARVNEMVIWEREPGLISVRVGE